jgi:hypothetical protein
MASIFMLASCLEATLSFETLIGSQQITKRFISEDEAPIISAVRTSNFTLCYLHKNVIGKMKP